MTRYENANHEKYIRDFNTQTRYDYERRGLMSRIMSSSIVTSKNAVLRFVIDNIERQFVFVMHYVDELKYFKQYLHRNY